MEGVCSSRIYSSLYVVGVMARVWNLRRSYTMVAHASGPSSVWEDIQCEIHNLNTLQLQNWRLRALHFVVAVEEY